MKPDYKNWMPKGMVYSFLFAALGCGAAAAASGQRPLRAGPVILSANTHWPPTVRTATVDTGI